MTFDEWWADTGSRRAAVLGTTDAIAQAAWEAAAAAEQEKFKAERIDAEMTEDVLREIRGFLRSRPRRHGTGGHDATPPMMYPEWIACVVDAAVRVERGRSSFQDRVNPWLVACFGAEIAGDKAERCHRFLEEALELVQAAGCPADDAHKLVGYVYGRPSGDLHQEVGGVMTTLAALCLAYGQDMHDAGEVELARVWTKVEQIREKQRRKPVASPLPGSYL